MKMKKKILPRNNPVSISSKLIGPPSKSSRVKLALVTRFIGTPLLDILVKFEINLKNEF